MWKIFVLIVCSFGLCYSCKKKEIKTPPPVATEAWEQLNGTYKGIIYKWNRNYDTDHVHVVEFFDTIRDVSASLEINIRANKISFGGVEFPYHDSLYSFRNRDTIFAIFDPNFSPYRSILIVRSQKFVQVYTNHYAKDGGPLAFYINENYYRQ